MMPAPAQVFGLDVSHYQAELDWKLALAQGNKFCSAKASDGLGSPDAMFARHRAGAKAAGLLFCGYHFFRQDDDPIQQAQAFMKAMGGVEAGELPPMLDLEWDNASANKQYHDGGQMDDAAADRALACLEEIEKYAGVTPLLYTSFYFFAGFANPARFASYAPWLAAYETTWDKVKCPQPWAKPTFWQYTDNEKIGAVDAIDGDVFFGTYAQLAAMVKQ